MKDRAGGDRGFLRALGAHPQALAGEPSTPAAAFRAGESIRPSKLREVFAAGGVVGEPGLELLKGAGVVNPTDGTRRRWRWHGSDSTALKQICRTYVRMVDVRWDAQQLDLEEPATLPGLPTVRDLLRSVEVPEFPGLTFHEVRAKSALNAVPKASAMPFGHTINPYRGCSHACVYCVGPDTNVLMADGRQVRIGDPRVGDRIVGTERRGAYRCYVETEVLAHWSTVKPAHRVTLADGTEILASGDHRFLTGRGWKHVTGAGSGAGQRPHLTANDEMLGFGRSAVTVQPCADHRRGYLTSMVRGDGHLTTCSYERAGRAHGDVHRFRLALTDVEGLHRTRDYLARAG